MKGRALHEIKKRSVQNKKINEGILRSFSNDAQEKKDETTEVSSSWFEQSIELQVHVE